jgi:hypothetical protein
MDRFRSLKEGNTVEFIITRGPIVPQAASVTKIPCGQIPREKLKALEIQRLCILSLRVPVFVCIGLHQPGFD